jgi:choline dehydrogenase-like flavoprotein
MTVVVIGSGPAGAAAAHALCDAGMSVTVLDAGDTIEPGRMEPFDALARSEPQSWPAAELAGVRDAFPVDVKHVPLKPAYGSLYPYVGDDGDLQIANCGTEALSSLAYGGLSNAWGASILPYRDRDIADWPISVAELEPHYRAVTRIVPVAAQADELSAILPLYADKPGALRRGRQSARLLEHLRRHAAALGAAGFTFGASRLAVVADPENERHCRRCGLCLYGCPYKSIYSAAHTFDALRAGGKAQYRGGIYVERLSEADGRVAIDFHERGRPSARGRMSASRVFVACGAISSTRLMLSSMRCATREVAMQDSQYFLVPMIAHRGAPVSVATQGNTLAQLFIELEQRSLTRHGVHLQVYGYNDIMLSALAARVPLEVAKLERLLRPVLGRLFVIQGFMHSADSPGLTLDYQAAGQTRIAGRDAPADLARVKRLVRYLRSSSRLLGMTPISNMLHVGPPGKSNHLGGSLPMGNAPSELATDTLGRLRDWPRVHVVDAAVFPSVPATTVTLSVMANAHRIATASLGIDA